MDSLDQKRKHKDKFQEQLKKLLTVDGHINIFAYRQLLKSESDAFRERGAEEYRENEIKLRLISSRVSLLLIIAGVVGLAVGGWWHYVGVALLAFVLGLFVYRKGHVEGYVWGHQVGFESGVDRTLCIEKDLSRSINDEIEEIEVGSL